MLLADIYRHQAKNDLAEQNYKEAVASCGKGVGTTIRELIKPLESLASLSTTTLRPSMTRCARLSRIQDITQESPTLTRPKCPVAKKSRRRLSFAEKRHPGGSLYQQAWHRRKPLRITGR